MTLQSCIYANLFFTPSYGVYFSRFARRLFNMGIS
jgi:hypothetical protein